MIALIPAAASDPGAIRASSRPWGPTREESMLAYSMVSMAIAYASGRDAVQLGDG